MTPYEIWVLEYAYSEDFPANLLVYGSSSQARVRLPYAYTVLRSAQNVVLVDVGFSDSGGNRRLAEKYGVRGWQNATTVLSEIGLRPTDVDTVIVTHAHFDHIGNFDSFPNAHFWMQQDEITESIAMLAMPEAVRGLAAPVDPDDLFGLARLAHTGRLHLLSGDAPELLPGVDVVAAFDTHTPGSLWVKVHNPEATYALPGDNLYSWDSLDVAGHGSIRPTGLAINNLKATIHAAEMLDAVGGEPIRVVPTHEDRLREAYPSYTSSAGLWVTRIA